MGRRCVTGLLPAFGMLAAMKTNASPSIASFVIRFVVDDPPQDGETRPGLRGTILHIQSNDEMSFSAWENAVEFIQRFVPLEAGPDHGGG